MKVAIIGFGLSGSIFHAPFIVNSKNFRLVAVVSSKPKQVNAQHPHVSAFNNVEEMLRNTDVDLVVISTPNDTHYDLAKTCLQHNKHVIVEKPFVTKLVDAEKLINLAQQKNLILCTYQNRRWDGPILKWRKLFNDGIFGDIFQCNLNFDRYRPIAKKTKWKELQTEGSGLWFDLGPHLLDHAISFFGIPETVYADIAIQRNNAVVDDYFHVILTYNKTKVILHSSSVILTELAHIQVYGDQASYICYGVDEQEQKLTQPELYKNKAPNKGLLSIIEQNTIKNIDLEIPMGNYQGFYDEIYKSISLGVEQPISHDDMLANVMLLELAVESSKSGQKKQVKF